MIDFEDKDKAAEQLLDAIRNHLRATGQSKTSFSLMISGNDGFVKNIEKGSLPSADRIHRLAKEFGWEFYFGPPRSSPQTGEAGTLTPTRDEIIDAVTRSVDSLFGVGSEVGTELASPKAEDTGEPSTDELLEIAKKVRRDMEEQGDAYDLERAVREIIERAR